MIGYIGLSLLMLSYFLLVTNWNKFFIQLNAIASTMLSIHAYIINDIVFMIVNGWIAIFLIIKLYKNIGEKKCVEF